MSKHGCFRTFTWLCFFSWSFVAPTAAGAQAVLEVSASLPEIPAGGKFELIFTLKGAKKSRIISPDFAPFKTAGVVEQRTGMSFENGQVSNHRQWIYHLKAPNKPGVYNIAPARAVADGQEIMANALTLTVQPGVKNSPKRVRTFFPDNDDTDLFLALELSDDEAVTGQQIICKVNLYNLIGVSRYDFLQFPECAGAYTLEIKHADYNRHEERHKGRDYAVQTLHAMSLFPQKTGTLRISPGRIRMLVEDPGNPLYGVTPIQLATPGAQLKVRALPDSLPPTFIGCAGKYEFELFAEQDTIRADEALTLRVKLRGNGDPRRFSSPALLLPAGLEAFEPKTLDQKEFENGQYFVHTRTLEYTVLPRDTGRFDIFPRFSWFNTDSNGIATFSPGRPFYVVVLPAKAVEQPIALAPGGKSPAFWRRYGDQLIGAGVLLLAAALLALYFILQKKMRRLVTPKASAKQKITAPITESPSTTGAGPDEIKAAEIDRNWLAEARARLAKGQLGRPFFDFVYKSLLAHIGGIIHRPALRLNHQQIEQGLTENGLSTTRIDDLIRALSICEYVLFAGQDHDHEAELVLDWIEHSLQA